MHLRGPLDSHPLTAEDLAFESALLTQHRSPANQSLVSDS